MAMLGEMLGRGYVSGLGVGRIFQDLDNPKMLFFYPDKSDNRRYISRDRAQFRRVGSKVAKTLKDKNA